MRSGLALFLLGLLSKAAAQFGQYDYVVVGAGTAGCAVARRLNDQGFTVLLFEEGDLPPSSQEAYLDLLAPRNTFYQWERGEATYRFFSEASTFGTRWDMFSGKGLGGSTKINANLYSRPDLGDFDGWGVPGWGSEDMKAYFEEIEGYEGGGTNHGTTGPLRIVPTTRQNLVDEAEALFSTLGFTKLEDGTTGELPTSSFFEHRGILQPNGQRLTSYDAYVAPTWSSGNPVTILPNSKILKIETAQGASGLVATGVYVNMMGAAKSTFVRVAREVIVTAGVFGTPKLLQLSGIGPAAALTAAGIPVVLDSPQVGENLMARPLYPHAYTGTQVLPEQDVSAEADPMEAFNFFNTGGGYYSYPLGSILAFGNYTDTPNPQWMVEFSTVTPPNTVPVPSAVVFACMPTDVKSRGSVSVRSSDPFDDPKVDPRPFTDPFSEDITALVSCISSVRAAFSVNPALGFSFGSELLPGSGVQGESLLYTAITQSQFSYHAFGSMRMGTDPATSAVNERLLVRGFENLRVADGSIIPVSIKTGPLSTIYAIAEKAADMIIEDGYTLSTSYDPTLGFTFCPSGNFAVISPPQPGTSADQVCRSFGLSPLSVNDPNLTCASQRAVAALQECSASEAYVRQRGALCDVLTSSSELLQGVDCSVARNVICTAV